MEKIVKDNKNECNNSQSFFRNGGSFHFFQVIFPALVFLTLILFYIILSFERNYIWRDPVYIWMDANEKSPSNARGFHNLAGALSDLGRYEEALEAYEATLKIEPDKSEAHYSMGYVYGKTGRIEDAKRKYADVLNLKFNNPKAHMNLGIIYKNEMKFAEAEKAYKIALSQNPYYGECYSNLGVLYATLSHEYRKQNNTELFNKYFNMANDNYVLAKKYNPGFPEAWKSVV